MNSEHLTEVLQSILDTACSCMIDTTYGIPADCYISHGEPADDCCDFLAVWVERIRPSHGFSDGEYITGGKLWDKCCDMNSIADVSIRLVRPCFPGLVDNQSNPLPSAEEMQAAAAALLVDVWVLECCVAQANCHGTLLPPGLCLELGIGDATPHGPQGGCAGWTWDLAVELDVCRC